MAGFASVGTSGLGSDIRSLNGVDLPLEAAA